MMNKDVTKETFIKYVNKKLDKWEANQKKQFPIS
jgi:hypothetical protein